MPEQRKEGFGSLIYNPVSYLGGILAAVMFVIIALLVFITWLGAGDNPYFGLVAFLILPPFLVLGLVMIPLGMLWERRRRRRRARADVAPFPIIDLNQSRARWRLSIFNTAMFAFLLLTAIGSYNAYHYTETTGFCGSLCHEVMEPEHTAYSHSPHARVKCVECHVGSGAGFFVKSKLSGLYQVYAVLANAYPTPIPTPVKSLRPAQETCEECHWPAAFFGQKQRQLTHHMYNEVSQPWQINMLVKIGGGSAATSQTTGIHWHMNIANEIDFIPTDSAYQDIPWVRMVDLTTNETRIYQDTENPLDPAAIDSLTKHRMDCIDCHNRPSHIYNAPDGLVDLAINTERLNPSLPNVKAHGVEVLTGEYATYDEAMQGIANGIRDSYAESEAPVSDVDQAIATLQDIYSKNFFPEMKVRWDTHRNHIGHTLDKGCFRCHDGKHVNERGVPINSECTTCHVIISQGTPDSLMVAEDAINGMEFVHPVDIDDAWKEMGCYECHTGAAP